MHLRSSPAVGVTASGRRAARAAHAARRGGRAPPARAVPEHHGSGGDAGSGSGSHKAQGLYRLLKGGKERAGAEYGEVRLCMMPGGATAPSVGLALPAVGPWAAVAAAASHLSTPCPIMLTFPGLCPLSACGRRDARRRGRAQREPAHTRCTAAAARDAAGRGLWHRPQL
jgi:hypothetical protein